MSKPPAQLDGADVLCWAWSKDKPFGSLKYPDDRVAASIHGLAICRYEGDRKVYQFRCSIEWEVEGDFDYDSLEDAKQHVPEQYRNAPIRWSDYVAD